VQAAKSRLAAGFLVEIVLSPQASAVHSVQPAFPAAFHKELSSSTQFGAGEDLQSK
jgi:hypothetical protein